MTDTLFDGADPHRKPTTAPLGVRAETARLPLPPRLRTASPYGAPQLPAQVRLNVNESLFSPSSRLLDDVAQSVRGAAANTHRYPDREAHALRRDLADYLTRATGVSVSPINVWPANGSSEVLQQLLLAFGGAGRCVLGSVPSYSMYRIIAEYLGAEWIGVPRRADFSLDIDDLLTEICRRRPDVTVITRPHSPTGHSSTIAEIEHIATAAPGIVVVDEAYAEFSAATSAVALIDRFPTKVVVTRTLSKAFGFAGGRLGYLVAAPAVIDALRLVRLPYHLSSLTQAAARAVLRHADDILDGIAEVLAERDRIRQHLRDQGFHVVDSDANFILFGGFADASQAWARYLNRGVLIRDVGLNHHLRVTVGTRAENDRFLAVSAQVGPASEQVDHRR
ncbi:histidinol-phosphate transaminase [Nocardia sp. CA-119907]|uniref:histidinol-phosphate transaminase n=1 Tax=Nocardia sp. CA-119907 TaxID=3239973 RepID=UPI003D95CCE7